jgi:hypothetical protein
LIDIVEMPEVFSATMIFRHDLRSLKLNAWKMKNKSQDISLSKQVFRKFERRILEGDSRI